jgi:tripartite-type tricarboxylate transporter receptor subunit TctC
MVPLFYRDQSLEEATYMTPAQMAAFLREERQRWGTLIKDLAIEAK